MPTVFDHDAQLAVGQEVWFRFTNCGCKHRVRVRITKVNTKSVLGEGLEEYHGPSGGEPYPKGFSYKVPRVADKTWTDNNRVEWETTNT